MYHSQGGESVSFAKTSLALYILYSLFLLLSTLWLLCGSSGLRTLGANLRTLLSCAHLYGWALPVPPCERIFSAIYFGIVARHGIVVLRSFPRISPKISLSRAHNLYNIVCFSSFYFFKIYMEKIKFTKIFHI